MNRVIETGGNFGASDLRLQNLDLYISECNQCAQTCRTWAETCAGGAGRVAVTIDACLDCANTCEATARAISLHKQGIRNAREAQLEACVVTCRLCARQCDQQADDFDGLSVCANAARRCEELISALLRPKAAQVSGLKIFTFIKKIMVR